MPQIKVEEADINFKFENPTIKEEAWIKPPPSGEPMVFLETPDDEKDFIKEDIMSLALGQKAHAFVDNVTMHGVRYVFARDVSRKRRSEHGLCIVCRCNI